MSKRRLMPLRLLAACLLAGGACSSGATAVAGPGGTADQGRRLVYAAPVAGAETQVPTLVSARIEAVDLKAGTITLHGKAVPLHPGALRILGPGGHSMGGPASLRAGMQVRIALEAEPRAAAASDRTASSTQPQTRAAPAERRIVLIYVDSTS
jgi:hypothetical protein